MHFWNKDGIVCKRKDDEIQHKQGSLFVQYLFINHKIYRYKQKASSAFHAFDCVLEANNRLEIKITTFN